MDELSRVALSLPCGGSLTGLRVIRTLEALLPVWRATDYLRSDNGSEFVARQVKKWLFDHGIDTHYIDPGCAWQYPFSRELQQHLQNDYPEPLVFLTLAETKALTRQWLEEYNEIRPHGSPRRFIATPIPKEFP